MSHPTPAPLPNASLPDPRRRLRRGAGAVALCGAMIASAASAQSGSSLFVVGESASKSTRSGPAATSGGTRPVAPRTAVAAKPAAAKPAAAKSAAAAKASKTNAKPVKSASRSRASKGRPAAGTPAAAMALNGRWHDSECIPLTGVTHRPPLFVKRQYEFDDRRKSWRLDATVYASDACIGSSRLLGYRGEGSFAITGRSRVAANAYDASFKVDRWQATPATREGVLTLLNGRCGSGDFEEGRTLNLSLTGCGTLGIRPMAERPREFELIRVSEGKFYLGTRSFVPGLPDDRPTQISSYGMVRASQ